MPQGPSGLQPASWAEAFSAVQAAASKVKGNEIKAIAGKLTDAETMVTVKDLLNRWGPVRARGRGGCCGASVPLGCDGWGDGCHACPRERMGCL